MTFLKLRSVSSWAILFSFIMITHDAFPAKTTLDSIYKQYCSGDHQKAQDSLDNFIKANPSDADAYFLRHSFERVQYINEIESADLHIDDFDPDKISELKRLQTATALFAKRSERFDLIRRLLDFRSQNPSIEVVRLDLQGYLDSIFSNWDAAFQNAENAFRLDSKKSPARLAAIFYSINPGDTKVFQVYKSKIDRVPTNDPYRPLLQGIVLRIESLSGTDKKASSLAEDIIEKFAEAYSRCSKDSSIAIQYGTQLIHQYVDNLPPAKGSEAWIREGAKILEEMTLRKYYEPQIDISLALAFTIQGKIEESKIYLQKAESSKSYLSENDKSLISDIRSTYSNHPAQRAKNGFPELLNQWLIGVFAIALVIFIFKRIYWPSPSNADSITSKKSFVPIANFETTSGYTLADVTKLTAFLNSKGIETEISQQTNLGIAVFEIRVAPDEKMTAIALLKNKNR